MILNKYFCTPKNQNPMLQKLILVFLVIIGLVSCIPEKIEYSDSISVDLSNPEFRKVFQLKDALKVDSLYGYLRHSDPSLRYLAAMSFASVRDSSAIDSISRLLDDSNVDVRAASAYALGQSRSNKASRYLIRAFRQKDTADVNNIGNANILEAIGKIGDKEMLSHLSTISTYRNTDTLLLEGQARGIYRFALRGIFSEEGTSKMIELLDDSRIPHSVRLVAANYLHRTNGLNLSQYKLKLIDKFTSERNPHIKMALATALSRTSDLEVLPYLINHLKIEDDYRIKVNIIRSLRNYPYIQVVDEVIKYLDDADPRIGYAAANFLVQNGNPNDALVYREFLQDSMKNNVKSELYMAVLTHLPHYYRNTRRNIRDELKQLIDSTNDPYVKASYIKCLGNDNESYTLLNEIKNQDDHPIVQSTAVAALGQLVTDDQFVFTHKSNSTRVKKEIYDMLVESISSGDVGMIAAASITLADEKAAMNEVVDSLDQLENARLTLNLPKDIEAYRALSRAIAHLKGEKYQDLNPAFNHPINWSLLNQVNDSSLVVVKTNKGNFSFRLFTNEAPGSVLNFVDLVSKDFYDNNVIHRVVNNFVIQAGCPRGDGYGSLNYSIRSDLFQSYYDDEGYVGMASAGNNTECTQWFVTHSPTPHLDGNYSIFGKVTEGMEVVMKLEIGDTINDIIITKF